ncbi:premnaspirodiene oxygenase-like [Phalaenopsis equestris]|uniref:premnaspirodiene oxygenase-like n=1 Tax=Phalaenopsis equestris TaxID=78828 RepID=UPI0009E2BF24|nr:premnaspirodiene oxygenase-like [Phalaenopsis equestris]
MESLNLCQILPLILCILLLFLILKKLKSPKFSSTIKLPPGPTKLPIIGNIFQLLGDHPHRRLRDLANEYGPLLLLKLGEINHIVVTSSEVASKVMKTHDINFASRPEFLATKMIFYDGSGIGFSPYGKYWSQLRKICTVEVLSAKRVQSFSFLRKEEGDNIVNKIRMARGSPVNLSEMFLFLTRTTISRAVFGRDIAHKKNFLNAMRDASRHLSGFDIVDLFPSLKSLKFISKLFISKFTPSRARLERVRQILDEILDEIFEEHQARNFTRHDCVEDIVDVLFRLQNQGELDIPLTTDNIKAVLLDLFLPGTITSSATLEWAMSELIKNPNILKKVQLEVRNAFTGKEIMEEKDISKLPYLNMVIKETARLHPAGPLLLPRVCRNTVELDGYTIPAGSRIMINAWAIMREPKCWVDSETFRPERFEEATFDFKGSNFEYIPFGGGMRSCPGVTFAIAGIEYWLAQLLFHFDWELPGGMSPEELDMEEVFGLTISRKNDLLVVATPYK